MSDDIKSDLVGLIETELANNQWKTSDCFYQIKSLSIDQRGRVGEHFFKMIFTRLNCLDRYQDNATGDWDLEAAGFKIEVKTATLDVNNCFQHEGIKANKIGMLSLF